MKRNLPKIKLYFSCPACYGTGKKLEGVRLDENGELEYYEDVLGVCSKCQGKGYEARFVSVVELKRFLGGGL